MLSLFLKTNDKYDGSQLAPLHNYLKHDLLGNSVVAWVGPCNVHTEHMIDGEDLKVNSAIKGDSMLHLVIEIFDQSLHAGVLWQRLIGEITRQCIFDLGEKKMAAQLERRGDDLFVENRKLNISIATCSSNSILLHFGINMTNEGTPVETSALADFGITDGHKFSELLLHRVAKEVQSQIRATQKVKTF